jgi:hypothetical protein
MRTTTKTLSFADNRHRLPKDLRAIFQALGRVLCPQEPLTHVERQGRAKRVYAPLPPEQYSLFNSVRWA